MKRSQPLKRRSRLRAGGRVKPVNRERKAAAYARNFGAEADAVRAMPCVVDAAKTDQRLNVAGAWREDGWCMGPVQAAHVLEARKMGACGGDRFGLAPLCATHHPEAGERGTSQRAAFEARYGLDLDGEADRIALEHERPLGIRGLADRWASGRAAALEAMGVHGDGATEQSLLEWAFQDDEHGGEALLGWVRRELERETDRRCARRCKSLDLGPDWSGRVDWDSDRLALAYHVGQTLGGALEDPNLALHLCAAAADRFGGWPA